MAAIVADAASDAVEKTIPPVAEWPRLLPSSPSSAGVPKLTAPRDKINLVLRDAIKGLVALDTNSLFLVPVTEAIAPGYFKVIKNPMDLSTMQAKATRGMYHGPHGPQPNAWAYGALSALEKDLCTMLTNATLYNKCGEYVHNVSDRACWDMC